jgi:tRNA(Ile2) 2-agmatinylcytidine synthetase
VYIAFDDTDSRKAMCTTYIVSEFLRAGKYDLIGLPSLVRLNPNIPYKTRGNGAVRMRIGKGAGKKHFVAEFQEARSIATKDHRKRSTLQKSWRKYTA